MSPSVNPYGTKSPPWLKHLTTGAMMIAAGAIAWNNVQRDVQAADALAKENQKAVRGLSRSVGEINTKQQVIINRLGHIEANIERERDVQKERHDQSQKSLQQIIDTLNRRELDGANPR